MSWPRGLGVNKSIVLGLEGYRKAQAPRHPTGEFLKSREGSSTNVLHAQLVLASQHPLQPELYDQMCLLFFLLVALSDLNQQGHRLTDSVSLPSFPVC